MPKLSDKVLWRLFIGTALLQFVSSVFYFLVFTEAAVVQPIYALTKAVMFAAPLAMIGLGFRLPKFSLAGRVWPSVGLGLASGAVISGAIFAVFTAFRADFQLVSGLVSAKVTAFGIADYYVAAAVVFSLLHSLFEEYFWRWYVVRGLETRLTPARAAGVGAALFALHHYVVLSQFFGLGLTLCFGTLVAVGGLVWSWTYRRTGSLLAPWLSHALVDGTLFYIGWQLMGR